MNYWGKTDLIDAGAFKIVPLELMPTTRAQVVIRANGPFASKAFAALDGLPRLPDMIFSRVHHIPQGSAMKRVTISVTDQLDAELVAFAKLNGYGNRSEAYRDVMRLGLEKARTKASNDSRRCVATLSHVFNHRMRELPARLSEAYHAHHDLLIANMRVHLDRELCLDVVVLRGEVPVVREFAQKIIAERGVTHGTVSFAPSGVDGRGQAHKAGRRELTHSHPKAKRGE